MAAIAGIAVFGVFVAVAATAVHAGDYSIGCTLLCAATTINCLSNILGCFETKWPFLAGMRRNRVVLTMFLVGGTLVIWLLLLVALPKQLANKLNIVLPICLGVTVLSSAIGLAAAIRVWASNKRAIKNLRAAITKLTELQTSCLEFEALRLLTDRLESSYDRKNFTEILFRIGVDPENLEELAAKLEQAQSEEEAKSTLEQYGVTLPIESLDNKVLIARKALLELKDAGISDISWDSKIEER